MEGVAGNHGANACHGLDAADVFPLVFRDGVEPDDSPGEPLGFPQGGHCPGLVDGLGVGQDDKGG